MENPTEDINEPVGEDTRVDIDTTLADNSGEFYVLNFDFSTLIDYGFAPNHHERTYTLFGVAASELVKVVYTFDDEEVAITEKVQVIRNTSFIGRFMRIQVTDNFLVVSNSEGEAPGISFFDHDWNLIHYFPRFPLLEAPYNLAVHEDPDLEMLQVFVAGPDTITIIEQVKNDDGQSFFNLSNEVFVSTAPLYTSASTFLAKSGDFLVVKQSNRRNLGLMPIC